MSGGYMNLDEIRPTALLKLGLFPALDGSRKSRRRWCLQLGHGSGSRGRAERLDKVADTEHRILEEECDACNRESEEECLDGMRQYGDAVGVCGVECVAR